MVFIAGGLGEGCTMTGDIPPPSSWSLTGCTSMFCDFALHLTLIFTIRTTFESLLVISQMMLTENVLPQTLQTKGFFFGVLAHVFLNIDLPVTFILTLWTLETFYWCVHRCCCCKLLLWWKALLQTLQANGFLSDVSTSAVCKRSFSFTLILTMWAFVWLDICLSGLPCAFLILNSCRIFYHNVDIGNTLCA